MLTASQHRTLNVIEDFIQRHNYAPTLAEIAQQLGIRSRTAVHNRIKALAAAGLIDIVQGQRRNIRLKKPTSTFEFPLLGKIAAGDPIEAVADKRVVNIAELFTHPNCYALQVKGESMIEDGIHDGDIVICEKRDNANNGDIVVALIDNQEATLKRIQFNANQTVTLFPANAKLKPITIPAKQLQIQGVFIGLLRMAK